MIEIDSKEVNIQGIKHDITKALEKFEDCISKIDSGSAFVLFYIDSTNANLIISLWRTDDDLEIDESRVFIDFLSFKDQMEEDEYLADEFDSDIISCLKKIITNGIGKRLKASYDLYYETELDGRIQF